MDVKRDAELALKVAKLDADVAQLELLISVLTTKVGELLFEVRQIKRDRVQ